MELHYIRILVSDFKISYLFYRDILCLALVTGRENDTYAEFQIANNVILSLYSRKSMAEVLGTSHLETKSTSQDTIAIVISVENVDEAFKQLKGRGAKFITSIQDRPLWGVRTVHLRDPDGNLLEIHNEIGPS